MDSLDVKFDEGDFVFMKPVYQLDRSELSEEEITIKGTEISNARPVKLHEKL